MAELKALGEQGVSIPYSLKNWGTKLPPDYHGCGHSRSNGVYFPRQGATIDWVSRGFVKLRKTNQA